MSRVHHFPAGHGSHGPPGGPTRPSTHAHDALVPDPASELDPTGHVMHVRDDVAPEGSGFRVQGLGFRVQGSGFRV